MIIDMPGDGAPRSLSIPIIIVATILTIVIGIAVGLSLNNGDESQCLEVPSSSQSTSPSPTLPSSTSSTSTSKIVTTTTTTSKSSETLSSTSSTSNVPTSSLLSIPSTTSPSSTTTNFEPASVPEGQDPGIGRSDLDGLGFVGSSTRCDSGDHVSTAIAAEQGIKTAACEMRSGEKYYRSDTPQGSGPMDIIVNEGDHVAAQNGSYRYQMPPDGVLMTKDDETVEEHTTKAWGAT